MAHLLETLIFEVVAEVEQLDNTMLEAHDNIAIEWNEAWLLFLELIVLILLRRNINIWNFRGTKWLKLINHHVKPNKFHLDLRIIGRLPQHDLTALMQR